MSEHLEVPTLPEIHRLRKEIVALESATGDHLREIVCLRGKIADAKERLQIVTTAYEGRLKELEREIARLKEPMACGHLQANWLGPFKDEAATTVLGKCSVCAAIEKAEAERTKWADYAARMNCTCELTAQHLNVHWSRIHYSNCPQSIAAAIRGAK